MFEYCDAYLETYFQNFQFFDRECADKRVREINMRTRRCLMCPGREKCRWHPEFWLEGEAERLAEDIRLRELTKDLPPKAEELEEEPEEEAAS